MKVYYENIKLYLFNLNMYLIVLSINSMDNLLLNPIIVSPITLFSYSTLIRLLMVE